MAKPCFSIGIDPGWKNLGLAIVKEIPGSHLVEPLLLTALNPSESKSPELFVLTDILRKYIQVTGDSLFEHLCFATIERYVAYANVQSSETENITSLIGTLGMGLFWKTQHSLSFQKVLLRAIDWKVPLVQMLAKNTGFTNPSLNLDKKFSLAAAKALLPTINQKDLKNDHEADALCLAALPFVYEKFGDKKRNPYQSRSSLQS